MAEWVQDLVTTLIPLLVIMDPLGNLLFFLLFTEHDTARMRHRVAALAALSACLILVFFALTGQAVLRFFAIDLPAFEIAGGFIFFIYGLQMLRLIPAGIKTTAQEEEEGVAKHHAALVPLGIPLLAGPGSITVVLVWQRNPDYLVRLPVLIAAIVGACFIVYIVFAFGRVIRRVLGIGGIRVLERLLGLFLAVLAVQFMVNGLRELFAATL